MSKTVFTPMREDDLPVVLDLYNHYVLTTTVTFHSGPVSLETLRSFLFLDHEWYRAYVIVHAGEVAGFCFLTPFKKRECYDRTVELGVYLKPQFTRRGLGTRAVRHLEQVAAAAGRKMLVASISGENTASIALFRKLGYEQCAHFRQIGEKWGRALDVVYFQRSLEHER